MLAGTCAGRRTLSLRSLCCADALQTTKGDRTINGHAKHLRVHCLQHMRPPLPQQIGLRFLDRNAPAAGGGSNICGRRQLPEGR
eukprot:5528518-Alexandrium_andersonii.AAC.1